MTRTLLYSFAFSALALLTPTAAIAETITISDPTGVSGTFEVTSDIKDNNAIGDYVNSSGTFNYVYQAFSVTATGAYSFGVTAANGEDVLMFLYGGSFDPSSPTSGFVAGNDDTEGPEDPSINPAYTVACSSGDDYYCPSLENM